MDDAQGVRGHVYDCGPCPYRADYQFRCFVPTGAMLQHYGTLMEYGLRRNHDMVYMPHCTDCQACAATRVDIAAYAQIPSRRSHKRCLKRNDDLQISVEAHQPSDERAALYVAYEMAIHNKDADVTLSYPQASAVDVLETIELHARYADGQLCAVSIIDVVELGMSSVYCYFDPAARTRSLGTYMALQEIELCQQYHKKWLYLGYYVADCQKLAYKAQFQPLQMYRDGAWRDHPQT